MPTDAPLVSTPNGAFLLDGAGPKGNRGSGGGADPLNLDLYQLGIEPYRLRIEPYLAVEPYLVAEPYLVVPRRNARNKYPKENTKTPGGCTGGRYGSGLYG